MSTYFNISDKIAVKKAPQGYTVAFAGDFINTTTATFTISNGTVGVAYYYTLEDSAGTTINGNGTFTLATATLNVDGTSLVDGLVTVSVYLINPSLGIASDTATRRAVTGAYVSALQGRMAIFEAEACAFAALTALQNTSIE